MKSTLGCMCFVEEDKNRRKENIVYFAKMFPEFFDGLTIDEVGQREIERGYVNILNKNILIKTSKNDIAQQQNDKLVHGWLEAFGMK